MGNTLQHCEPVRSVVWQPTFLPGKMSELWHCLVAEHRDVHINAIDSFQPRMQEIDPYIIRYAKVYVDQTDSCLEESGDLIKPIAEGIIQKNHIFGEIGNVCLGKIKGRKTED